MTNVHVGLQHTPLDLTHIVNLVRSDAAGAIVTFSGTTRNHFAGKEVLHLDYEAYGKMALVSLRQICEDAMQRFSLRGAACFHRLGRVSVGEESIMIAVSSDHRKAAWEAGEYILDEAKRQTEVWKRETFKEETGLAKVWKANEEFSRAPKS
ncbi:Molybdopterin biosynthesis MoaE [Protomyces lactucae-debilis]|uniref:Molybdopterin biosynthesis MoaE n=1 Tax=Protomyces lactucae-debilis TaxID=2754530 RepID=A0A1Y2FJU2_PROLT|nr:Molybdopterin biosynthesis MoaE [Protomyces lactucae-debilis]ORY84210.1 Molybdopterin biosynthesis MoaE [Protomyces lactucae-debilis]